MSVSFLRKVIGGGLEFLGASAELIAVNCLGYKSEKELDIDCIICDLRAAIRKKDLEKIQRIIKEGLELDPNFINTKKINDPNTSPPPLVYTCHEGWFFYNEEEKQLLEIIKCLVEQGGADVNLSGYSSEYSPLMEVCRKGFTEIASYLIHQGANLDTADQEGNTALIKACENTKVETVKLLLQRGANKELQNEKRQNALMCSTEQEIRELLTPPITPPNTGLRRRFPADQKC